MPKKRPSNVDVWLERETPRIRRALESASRYFDVNDRLTVNTLEAVYARESSFGTMLGKRGVDGPSGHFKFEAPIYEVKFAKKSPANKTLKEKGVRKGKYLCTEGHWVTIDDRPVFICD